MLRSNLLCRALSLAIALQGAAAAVLGGEMREINPPAAPEAPGMTALFVDRLIDGRGGKPVEDAVVVWNGDRIVAAGARQAVDVPEAAHRIEGGGMSLLPGLIDSHFHSRNNIQIPVEYQLRHGITSFRDPGHPFRYYDRVMRAVQTMPRVFLCGAHLDGPPPVWPDQAIVIQDEQHARRTVREHVERGASAIKVYFRLPLKQIEAVCQAADELGVPVTAHLELVDADAAIRAGVRGIEHVTSFGTALADPAKAAHFKARVTENSGARNELRHWLWSTLDLDQSPRVQSLLDLIVGKGVFVSPTLAIFERRSGVKQATEEEAQGFANMLRFVGLCHQAGAKVVVGSHTHAPVAEPGRAYQRELELLVEAGLTPLEAITAGTKHNAEFFGIDSRLGTIQAGRTADLILVEGDPSRDITAMRHVKHVLLNGNWFGDAP